MKAEIEDFKTGWYGISIGLKSENIDTFIQALQKLKHTKSHFHLRGDYEGVGGIGDIEIYWEQESDADNMEIQ